MADDLNRNKQKNTKSLVSSRENPDSSAMTEAEQ